MNNWQRSQTKREAAELGKKIVDPAEWYPADVEGKGHWIWQLSDKELTEVQAAVASVEADGLDLMGVTRDNFPLPTLAANLKDLQDELIDGRGFVLIRGLPVADMTRPQYAAAFWGLGLYLGRALCQNAQGHMLGHVKDLQEDYSKVRGYMTNAHMAFHCDQCDLIALACVNNAKEGGHHMICSSVALHNEILKRAPDLAAELGKLYYRSRQGELPPGETDPWVRQPVFGFEEGYFAARGVSAAIDKAQGLPGVPDLTDSQRKALQMFKETAPELAIEIPFQPGDVLILCNHVTLHSRTEFEDWPEPERKRHLLRLWLSTDGARPVPPEIARWSNGVYTEETEFFAPLDVS